MPKYAARIDANHRRIRRLYESIPGVSVADTSGAGSGFPDLVVGFRGLNFMIEVKDGDKPPSRRKLTTDQETFHSRWTGQIAVVKNEREALVAIGI